MEGGYRVVSKPSQVLRKMVPHIRCGRVVIKPVIQSEAKVYHMSAPVVRSNCYHIHLDRVTQDNPNYPVVKEII